MPCPADCRRLTSGTDEVRPHVPDAPGVTLRQPRPRRPRAARTIAPAHVTGPYVKVLDAGDLLTPGRGRPDLAALEADPTLGRATSRALDRPPDGKPSRRFPACSGNPARPASGATGLLYRKPESQAAHVDTGTGRLAVDLLAHLSKPSPSIRMAFPRSSL